MKILIVNHKDTSLRKYPIKDIYNFDDIVKTFDLYKNKKIKSYLVVIIINKYNIESTIMGISH
jgi:hypothetical protein